MNPYTLLLIGLTWLASLGAVGWWQRHDGATAERVTWQLREAAELRTANTRILDLEEAARVTEQRRAAQMSALDQRHQQEIRNAQTRHQADLAAARAGSLILRDPGAARQIACADRPAEPGATPGQRDGGQAGRLSAAAAEFLLDLAHDADRVAEQLAACQGVIQADRSP